MKKIELITHEIRTESKQIDVVTDKINELITEHNALIEEIEKKEPLIDYCGNCTHLASLHRLDGCHGCKSGERKGCA